MSKIRVPKVSPEIISWLEQSFPLAAFLSSNTLEDLHFKKGQQSVIALLRRELEDQLKDSLRS